MIRTHISALLLPLVPALAAPQGVPWDLAAPTGPTSSIYMNSANGGQLGTPLQAADFNGDGFMDTAVAPFTSSTNGRSRNGQVWVVFGDGTIGATVDVATYTGPRLAIRGVANDALLGVEMSSGDLDGDGYADLILGSSHGVHIAEAARAGEVVILYGSPDWGTTIRDFDLNNLPSTQRTRFILGAANRTVNGNLSTGDRLGSWLQLHDLDGNGLADLVMGMDQSWGPNANRDRCGACVIAWDVNSAFGDTDRLRVGEAETADVFTVIYGRDPGDMLGSTHTAGDLDDDGHLDLIVGAGVTRSGLAISSLGYTGTGGGDGPNNTTSNSGEVYILWGAEQLRSQRELDMATADPSVYTIIYGEQTSDYFGEELVSADVTGDGIDDLVVGALGYDAGALSLAGAGYLLRGGAALRGKSTIFTAAPPADYPISCFVGTENFGILADTIELADLNQDGIAEILMGAPYGSPLGRYQAGYATILYGGQNFPNLPTRIGTGLTVSNGLLYGIVYGAESYNGRGDYFVYSSVMGDYDGDGVLDFVPNAMQGDGYQNAYNNAGECYILSGIWISRHAAAPMNVRRGTTPDVLGTWSAAQPILGPITGYRVRYSLGGVTMEQEVGTTTIATADLPIGSIPIDVATIMDANGGVEYSLPVAFPGFLGIGWELR
ncbi:hypothetical protein GC173_13980 [bacterium]|nr:hypothetical protein [bacterium]